MDTMYQRSKIQDESLYYESRKHDGSLPLVGVNTFLPREHAGEVATEIELIRSTEPEKAQQIANVRGWQANRNRLAPEGETVSGHIAGADESGDSATKSSGFFRPSKRLTSNAALAPYLLPISSSRVLLFCGVGAPPRKTEKSATA